jgi:hypothetical protein
MEKIGQALNPGAEKDNQIPYGSGGTEPAGESAVQHKGQVAGDGSHFARESDVAPHGEGSHFVRNDDVGPQVESIHGHGPSHTTATHYNDTTQPTGEATDHITSVSCTNSIVPPKKYREPRGGGNRLLKADWGIGRTSPIVIDRSIHYGL